MNTNALALYQLVIANKNYSSWSLRPWLLMKQCGIGFQEVLLPFGPDPGEERFRQYSPTGKVPCLLDGDRVVWDSLGIVEYLADRHPGVWPSDDVARGWARCAAAEMHSEFAALREICGMNIGIRVQLREKPQPLLEDLERLDRLWCEGLRRFGGPYLAGSRFTAADAFFAPVVFRLQTYGLSLSARAIEYATRLMSLPAMQEWQKAALAETLRDPAHDDIVLQYGQIVADHRAKA